MRTYLSTSCCFLSDNGTFTPLQSNHQCKAAAVCFVYGSARTTPGISSELREISVLLALIATLLLDHSSLQLRTKTGRHAEDFSIPCAL